MRATQTILIALALAGGAYPSPAGPFAVEVTRAHGPFGPAPYNDPAATLGAPATWFYDPLGGLSGGPTNRRVKLVEAAYNVSPPSNGSSSNLLLTLGNGGEIIVRFDQPVTDDPAHPYGIDLLVFGNCFYAANGFAHDGVNMNTLLLTGSVFPEPLKVSVSPGFTGQPGEVPADPDTWPWYRYDNGPFADTVFPTHAFHWDRATTNWSSEPMDFTKPVNPVMASVLSAGGLSAADAIELYVGSGGGTGFNLRESGFAWIQYVKVEGVAPGFSNGEIDAFAAVRPMVLGDALAVAPENVLSNTATLSFQRPGAETQTVVAVSFTTVSDLARVTAAWATNLGSFAPVPGTARTAVQLNLSPLLGSAPVAFTADLAVSVGIAYTGNGDDLLLLQAVGTNWNSLPFTYTASNGLVRATGLTNLSTFVVAQLAAPALCLTVTNGGVGLQFTPLPGLAHALERSTNLVHWTALGSFTASNALPVVISDIAPPPDRAFYRLAVRRP